MPASAAGDTAIRPFQVHVPEAALVDLRRRIAETRWPDRETVTDRSQGNQLGKLKEIVRYWGTGYDWRKVEARLNVLPMFMTEIDEVDISFHSREIPSRERLASHHHAWWPGSIMEFLKVIDPLTNPTAHGASAATSIGIQKGIHR